jgi:hypothetical protein
MTESCQAYIISVTVGLYCRPVALRYIKFNLNLMELFKNGHRAVSERDFALDQWYCIHCMHVFVFKIESETDPVCLGFYTPDYHFVLHLCKLLAVLFCLITAVLSTPLRHYEDTVSWVASYSFPFVTAVLLLMGEKAVSETIMCTENNKY